MKSTRSPPSPCCSGTAASHRPADSCGPRGAVVSGFSFTYRSAHAKLQALLSALEMLQHHGQRRCFQHAVPGLSALMNRLRNRASEDQRKWTATPDEVRHVCCSCCSYLIWGANERDADPCFAPRQFWRCSCPADGHIRCCSSQTFGLLLSRPSAGLHNIHTPQPLVPSGTVQRVAFFFWRLNALNCQKSH